jgi:hypothetical protein
MEFWFPRLYALDIWTKGYSVEIGDIVRKQGLASNIKWGIQCIFVCLAPNETVGVRRKP